MKIDLLDPAAREAVVRQFAAEAIAEMGEDGKQLTLTFDGTKVRAAGPNPLVDKFGTLMGGKLKNVTHG